MDGICRPFQPWAARYNTEGNTDNPVTTGRLPLDAIPNKSSRLTRIPHQQTHPQGRRFIAMELEKRGT